MQRLVITVDFEDDSDFDFYRARLVGAVEEAASEATDGDDARADGKIEVSWDTEDVAA